MPDAKQPHRVVVVGGGFGGLNVCRRLQDPSFAITLVDRRNFHLFQPLLYQVATGALSPANIASPLRAVLKRRQNVEVLLAEVVGFEPEQRRVVLSDGHLEYDTLVVAAGVRHHYFGQSHWEPLAPGLKTIEEATEIRRRILLAFEMAERLGDSPQAAAWLTFVVVGAGPTGVEMAGAIGELAQHTLRHEFRRTSSTKAQVLLLEGLDRVLPGYPPELCAKAEESLRGLGVSVRTSCRVTQIGPDSVTVSQQNAAGETVEETLAAHTTLWAAGVQASPLGKALADATGASLDRAGRVIVEQDCSLPGHPEMFVIGDLAHFNAGTPENPQLLPGVAPVAIQQGRYVASLLQARRERRSLPAFRYKDRGMMATIGRAKAVAKIGRWRFSGYLAWLAWLFVHLMFLVEFHNRILVFFQWAWNYFTRNRTARLITGEHEMLGGPVADAAQGTHAQRKATQGNDSQGNRAQGAEQTPTSTTPSAAQGRFK